MKDSTTSHEDDESEDEGLEEVLCKTQKSYCTDPSTYTCVYLKLAYTRGLILVTCPVDQVPSCEN